MSLGWRAPFAVTTLSVVAAACYWLGPPQVPPDLWYWWSASRAVMAGQEPYHAVELLGRASFWYPFTAVIAILPVASLPLPAAHLTVAALTGLAFAIAAPKLGPGVLAGCLSSCYLAAVALGQWSPLLLAGAAIPWLAATWVVKPTIGLAWFAGYPSLSAAKWCAGFLALSLLLAPTWPIHWYQATRGTPHSPLFLRPGGFLLLLAFIRWRDPRCRVLAMLAVVPQLPVLYEALPVFLVCRSRWEGYGLATLSWAVEYGQWATLPGRLSFPDEAAHGWPILLGGLYLPALALALRPVATPEPMHDLV